MTPSQDLAEQLKVVIERFGELHQDSTSKKKYLLRKERYRRNNSSSNSKKYNLAKIEDMHRPSLFNVPGS